MKDYYEELWERLPDDLHPPDLALRRAFALANVAGGDRVLDLGCGAGDLTADLAAAAGRPAAGRPAAGHADGGHAVGVDVAQAAVRRARERHPALDFRVAPIDGPLPFPDGSFDVVWSSEVIEHVADTARWLSEVRRVLAPSGRLLLTTPSHGRLRLLVGGVERYSEPLGDHLHLYTARSLRALLHEFGFADVRVHPAGGPPLWRRLLTARAER
jgi:ubiquinone/menaquinone biosynthesis C-methylase UbiE